MDGAAVYFVTVCAAHRGQNVLCTAPRAAGLIESVRFRDDQAQWDVLLLLLMPDHLHLLARFHPDPGMKRSVSDWKRYTARAFGVEWQRDFFDHRIRNAGELLDKTAYVRENPVRAGLVTSASEWPHVWSPMR